MFTKLDFILEKYEELSMLVADPEVISDQTRWRKLMKDMGDMEPIVLKYREYKKAKEELEDTRAMLDDSSLDDEMREMAKEEFNQLGEDIERFTEELKILLLEILIQIFIHQHAYAKTCCIDFIGRNPLPDIRQELFMILLKGLWRCLI